MRRFFLQFNLLIKSLRVQGSFARNFAITLSGNSIAIAAGLVFTPFISRAYSPDGYGSFAIYMAVAQNLSLLATLQLTRAFVLPEDEGDFLKLFQTSLRTSLTCSMVAGVIVLLFHEEIVQLFGLTSIANLIYLLPATVLLYALADILRSTHVRRKAFQQNATSQVVTSVTSRAVALIYGLSFSGNGGGLIVGDSVSKIIENVYLSIKIKLFRVGEAYSMQTLFSTLSVFRNYPLFVLPNVWLTIIANQMPLFFTARLFSTAATGNYSFANSLLNMPVAVLAGAISPVFLQKASEVYRTDRGEMSRIVKQLADRLFYLGLGPILMLTVFGDFIFKFILGEQWTLAGEFASFLGLHYLFFIVANPLATLYRIYGREHVNLRVTIGLVVTNIITMSLGYFTGNLKTTILLYSLGNIFISLVHIIIVFRMVSVPLRETVLRYVFVAASAFLILKVLSIGLYML